MSSTYVIPNLEKTKNKPIEEWEESLDYFVVAFSTSFYHDAEILLPYLSDDTPIVCIDNESSIKNLKELKEYFKDYLNNSFF